MWKAGNRIFDLLAAWRLRYDQNIEIIGPYVDTIKKIRNKFRIIVLIKGADLVKIKKYIKEEAEFHKTGIIIDVDPSI